MAGSDITLTHASVNSGAPVNLRGVSVQYGWKNLIKATPSPGYRDTVEVDNLGFENVRIIIRGTFDVDDSTANYITQTLLVDFATLKHTTAISCSIRAGVAGTSYLGGRPAAGDDTDGAQTLASTFNVIVESFDISFNTMNEEGQRWDYSLSLIETT